MEDLLDPNARCEHYIFTFMDRQGETIELHLRLQRNTRVAVIEFTKQGEKIPIPDGIIVTIINPRTTMASLHSPPMDRVIWFNTRHSFRVEYYGQYLCTSEELLS